MGIARFRFGRRLALNTLTSVANRLIELLRESLPRPGDTVPAIEAILLGIQEKNLGVLIALRRLAVEPGMGAASLILARTILEAMIGLEYMRVRGLDAWVGRFWRFHLSASREDMDYLREGGVDLGAVGLGDFAAKVDEGVEEYSDELMFRPGELARSWARMDCEKMIQWLAGQGEISAEYARDLVQVYRLGSRHTHLSPVTIGWFLHDSASFREHDAWEREMALHHGMMAMAIMATTVAQRRGDQGLVDAIETTVAPLQQPDES